MKVCPLRVHALEQSPENVRNFGSAVNIVEVGRDDDVQETISCLGEHCAWWDGEACAMLALPEVLLGIKQNLAALGLTIHYKE